MTMTLVRNLTAGLALAVAIVGGSGSALAQKKVAGNQNTTFDPQGAGTAAGQGTFAQQGLNSGTVVGYLPDEQFEPKKPSFNALSLYIA